MANACAFSPNRNDDGSKYSLIPLLIFQFNVKFNGGGNLICPNTFVDLPH